MKLPPATISRLLGWRPTGDLGPWTWYTRVNGTVVWFLRAPPTCPPSESQTAQRNVFRQAAAAWSLLPEASKRNWELATRRLSLRLTGYNLWVWYQTTNDYQALQTIQRHSGLQLIPPA